MSATSVVAGIGSEYRRDDGVGPAVARLVAQLDAGVVDLGPLGEPLDLLGRWDGAGLAVVIDAVRSGAPPGSISVLELAGDGAKETASSATSTHGIGLVGALRIARATGHAPERLLLVAVEGADFSEGLGLSPAVEASLAGAAALVIDLLGGNR